jgi:hypothetical protein
MSNVKELIRLAKTDLGYNATAKAKFHRLAKSALRDLAVELGYALDAYDLRSNLGGIAVSGEITLHSNELYVQLSQSMTGMGFMWRTCKHRKDYQGGANQWAAWDALHDLPALSKRMLDVVGAYKRKQIETLESATC